MARRLKTKARPGARLRREARILERQRGISFEEAYKLAQAKEAARLQKLQRAHEKAMRRVLTRKVPLTRPSDLKSKTDSTWPENPNKGYVSVVSGGLPSLGKRR